MPTITDWLMVIITLVYAVATIFIYRANIKSAKASKEELAEMKRQYAEENRPRIEVEFCYEKRIVYIVRFANHGKLTAQHVKIELDEDFIDSIPEQDLKNELRRQKNKECIIGVGEHYDLYISGNELRGNPNMKPVTGKLSYEDAEKRPYKSDIYIDIENYATFFSLTSEEPIVKELKNIKKEVEGLKRAVAALDYSAKEDEENDGKD